MCILAYLQSVLSTVWFGVFLFTLLSIFQFFYPIQRFCDIWQNISSSRGLNGSSLDRYVDMFKSCFLLVSAVCYCFYIWRQLLFTYTANNKFKTIQNQKIFSNTEISVYSCIPTKCLVFSWFWCVSFHSSVNFQIFFR